MEDDDFAALDALVTKYGVAEILIAVAAIHEQAEEERDNGLSQ